MRAHWLRTLCELQKTGLSHVRELEFYVSGRFMELDLSARRNLELTETMRAGEKRGSLLWVLDHTKTAMGSRMLRSWLEKPLLSPKRINARLDAVEELTKNSIGRDELVHMLQDISDYERVTARIVTGAANCRDLVSLGNGCEPLPELRAAIGGLHASMFGVLLDELDDLSDLRDEIRNAIVDEPPFSVREGGMIRDGYSEELDQLRDIVSGGKGTLARIEAEEREKTGIKTLRVGYNRVFGYYIEVSKGQTAQVPETYIRKQTLTTGERYITPELKELERTILTAKDRITALEYELFSQVRQHLADQSARIQRTARAVAALDVLTNFAALAARQNYCRPEIDLSGELHITDGRHPVVEQVLKDALFVPNDTALDCGANRVAILTGPNMAGKSTYMRQVALIVLMAQMGCFVPARTARIGVVDRIFTRIGASDDLASGQSTFMVEMTEVAEILKHATSHSLLILDEIGRGTSTFDGMAIARAVLEYAADKKRIGAKTLFATHYHELTDIEQEIEGVRNYNIAVRKRGADIVFLRKIVPGAADDSYGVEVARLAVCGKVVSRAPGAAAGARERRTRAHGARGGGRPDLHHEHGERRPAAEARVACDRDHDADRGHERPVRAEENALTERRECRMSWMFPRRSGIRAPEPREWILGALYLPVFLFFLNFAILTYFPALGFPLTEPRNYFFANLLYMTVNFAVMLLIFRRTLWQSLREFEGKMLLSVLIGFGMCYGANLVLTTAYTVLDIMPENYNQEAVNSLLGGYPLAMTLCTVVLAPLAEECLFRGVLFAPLARRCLPAAYALSMFLFAGMHVFQFLGSMTAANTILCLSLYLPASFSLCWVYQKTGNIWACIFLHMFINFQSVLASLLRSLMQAFL